MADYHFKHRFFIDGFSNDPMVTAHVEAIGYLFNSKIDITNIELEILYDERIIFKASDCESPISLQYFNYVAISAFDKEFSSGKVTLKRMEK